MHGDMVALLVCAFVYQIYIKLFNDTSHAVVEQTVSMRALCIFAARSYEAFFSGSKRHLNIESFGPV